MEPAEQASESTEQAAQEPQRSGPKPSDKLRGRVASRKREPRVLHGRRKRPSQIPRLEPEMQELVAKLKAEGRTVKVFYTDPNLYMAEDDVYRTSDGFVVDPDLADELRGGLDEDWEPTEAGPDDVEFADPDEIDDSDVVRP